MTASSFSPFRRVSPRMIAIVRARFEIVRWLGHVPTRDPTPLPAVFFERWLRHHRRLPNVTAWGTFVRDACAPLNPLEPPHYPATVTVGGRRFRVTLVKPPPPGSSVDDIARVFVALADELDAACDDADEEDAR